MRAARWLGQRDRMNVDLELDGVRYTVEFQAVVVHVEPDKADEYYASMQARNAQTINDLVLAAICLRMNGDSDG